MKVIIVNGFSNTPAGNESFKKFLAIVEKAFDYLYSCGMQRPTFVVLDRDNIASYLYLKNSKYNNNDTGRFFDSVDFVIMDGDANLLPWTKSAEKFGIFFKQCKFCDKVLFAAGFAFYMQIYYCATNFSNINVVNGNGWGTKLNEIHKFPTDKLISGSVFLDNETGDMYSYSNDTDTWMPFGNAGLHYGKNATTATLGRYIEKVKIYRGKHKINDIYGVYKSDLSEAICYVKKSFIQHWALAGIPQKFLVCAKNVWDPHPVNITQVASVGPNYRTLAESEKGCSIIEHLNTLAMSFHIDTKHKETIEILNNFIKHNVFLMQVLIWINNRIMGKLICL